MGKRLAMLTSISTYVIYVLNQLLIGRACAKLISGIMLGARRRIYLYNNNDSSLELK